MERKIQILLIFLSCLSMRIYSQRCGSIYETGDQLINEIKIGTVCFKRDTEKRSDNIYHTKYTFKLNNDFYYLEFTFFRSENRISVVYTNQFNTPRNKEIKFDPNCSLILFKDYKANEKNILKQEYYTILFGIPDEFIPYVTLYHFQLMDDETTIFKTRDVAEDKLIQHNKMASICPAAPPPPPPPPSGDDIKKIILEINKYEDSVSKHINNEIQNINIERPLAANESLSKDFSDKLDLIFKNYYKDVFPYQDFNSKIEMLFNCNQEGRIENLKSIRSINSLQIKWFEDNFYSKVMRLITSEKFKTMKDTITYKTIFCDYNWRFAERINKIKQAENVNPYDFNELIKTNSRIQNQFESYFQKEVNSPTTFTYTINYQSIAKHETWELKIDKNNIETLGPVNSTEIISQDLKNKFKINVPQKRKISKYQVKRCEVYMNGKPIGEDLQPE